MIARIATEADRPLYHLLGEAQVSEQSPIVFAPERWDKHFDDYLGRANPTIWLAWTDTGRCVGYAMASVALHMASLDRVANLNALYVRPDVRGSVAGGRAALALMAEFEAWCDRVGAIESVVGSTGRERMDIPLRFYARFGYAPVGAMRRVRG